MALAHHPKKESKREYCHVKCNLRKEKKEQSQAALLLWAVPILHLPWAIIVIVVPAVAIAAIVVVAVVVIIILAFPFSSSPSSISLLLSLISLLLSLISLSPSLISLSPSLISLSSSMLISSSCSHLTLVGCYPTPPLGWYRLAGVFCPHGLPNPSAGRCSTGISF